MVQSQYSLSWDSYKSNICDGLSALQQNEEFVDMTLAADGHFVKVHQILIALASPYLKSLISSAPCQHPVIFLNNISYKNLCSVLEYIYTGEVHMPSQDLEQFIETAKSLHIKGLDGITGAESLYTNSKIEDGNFVPMGNVKNLSVSTSGRNEQICLPLAARKIQLKNEAVDTPISRNQPTNRSMEASKPDFHDYANVPFMDDAVAHESDDNAERTKSATDVSPSLQFTVSIRGCLQIILNRFIYSVQSTAHKTGIRRWRCIDYRSNKCMAFVVTKGNVVLNRCNPHNHSFHDKKILSKLEKKCVYSVLEDVKDYKENDKDDSRDAEDMAMDEDFTYDDTMKLSENNET